MEVKLKLRETVQKGIADALFPIRCIRCLAIGEWVCPPCRAELPVAYRESHESGAFVIVSCFDYGYPLIAKLVHLLKYEYVEDIAATLAQLVHDSVSIGRLGCFMATSVPLHSRRMRERGFNQSERIAREFARRVPCDYTETLVRIRATASQVDLLREQRLKNVKHAFAAVSLQAIRRQDFILVDDVLTTGATMRAAASALFAAGARRVIGLAVAHG